jgi:hypothetical protein
LLPQRKLKQQRLKFSWRENIRFPQAFGRTANLADWIERKPFVPDSVTEDSRHDVPYLGYLLGTVVPTTGLLLSQLLAAPEPRVVTVASLAHRNGKIDF